MKLSKSLKYRATGKLMALSNTSYVDYARLCQQWPEETERQDRSFKSRVLLPKMNQLRDKQLSESDHDSFMYLSAVLNDDIKQIYNVPGNFRPLHRPAYGLLSSDAQTTMRKWKMTDFLVPIAQFELGRVVSALTDRFTGAKSRLDKDDRN